MASLESIRRRSGLVLGVVGLALVAFILGDFLSSGRAMQTSENTIGEINGETIDSREFEITLRNTLITKYGSGSVSEANRVQERKLLWDNMVKDAILEPEFEKLGLDVSEYERGDLMTDIENGNMSPIALQLFGLQGGNIPDGVSNNSIKEQITGLLETPQAGVFNYWENMIAKDRLINKYNNLIKKGLYVTSVEGEDYYNQQGKTVNGRYVYKSYASIPDTDISITDAEIKDYYNSHLDDYPQKEARSINYVVFNIKASNEDKQKAKKKINELLNDKTVSKNQVYETIPGFRNTDDPEAFVRANSDGPYNGNYLPKGRLSPIIDEIMHTSEIGVVYGPYEDGDSYKVARLLDNRSDSVKVAILEYKIIPSNNTSNEIFAKAGEFALQNKTPEAFKAAAEADNTLQLQTTDLAPDARSLNGYEQAREVTRWAFNEKTTVNSVKRFDDGEKYIVAILTDILSDGNQSLEKVKPQIEAVLRREKRIEMLTAEFESYLSSASDISALGAAAGLQVDNVSGVSFASNNITGVGLEPKIVGAFFSLDPQEMSGPVAGNKGVFVLAADGFVVSSPASDIAAVQAQRENALQPRVNYEVYNALKENVEITDNRNKFY